MNEIISIDRGCCSGSGGTCMKLEAYDWLKDVPNAANPGEFVEVRFKNTRRDYYQNINNLKLSSGDVVAVEASPGHDIGIVTMTGDLVLKQMKRHKVTLMNGELRKVYRKAKPADIDKWKEAIAREHETMLRSRQISTDLGLNMKIGDVEYQGDGTKAIFYYIADERVDFRQLIKVLADRFRIRIEMKQIGARQEAGRIGGIGPCGRELCCATWIGNFVSVSTNAARYQEISLNPQKLAGQCGKLKCCLNFEVDCYLDAQRDFPSPNVALETENGRYIYQKQDVFKGIFWYSPEKEAGNLIAVPVERVREIIRLNQRGKKADRLTDGRENQSGRRKVEYQDIVSQDSLTRFDAPKGTARKKRIPKKNIKRRNPENRPQRPDNNAQNPAQ